MESMRFSEYLRTKDMGIYRITSGYAGETFCFMLIMDLHRPSTLDDYPYLKLCYAENEDFGRDNFIKVVILSNKELDKEENNETMIVASQFLENKNGTDWNMDFYVISKKYFSQLDENRIELFKYAQDCAKKFGLEVDILNIPKEKFDNFTQC